MTKLSSFILIFVILNIFGCNNSLLSPKHFSKEEKRMVNYPEESINLTNMRESMVERQLIRRGIKDERVLKAMRKIQRHLFVPQQNEQSAYVDSPLPLTHGQTISQPYIVAFMTQAAQLKPSDKVLEIGTGSGYQATVLAEIVEQVFTIEIVEPLGVEARKLLQSLKYNNIDFKIGDGYVGWKEHAPFDAIIVTAAPPSIPGPLIDQLKEGGRLIIPVGQNYQELERIVKDSKAPQKMTRETLLPVRFVPMTGKAQE